MPTLDEERAQVLSERNRQTYQLAWQVHATGGACLTESMKADGLLMQNLAIVLKWIRTFERKDLAERLGIELARRIG